jgi:catechol 2,3-dioxygenase-like lactoylglutathione lyase family enzyme
MKVMAHHHVALRVENLERSAQFYADVFGARVAIDLTLDTEFAESIFGADPGTTGRNQVLVFDEGAIELIELTPSKPLGPTDQTSAGLMHFCFWVEDVPGTVDRVKAAGGQARFPIRPWHGHNFVYVEDPEGHVIELLDATMEECIQLQDSGLPDVTSEVG